MRRLVNALGKVKRACAVFALCAMSPMGVYAQTFTTLFSFNYDSGSSGPYAGLVQATDGNLYGTTYSIGPGAYGTFFKITTSGALTTLYDFSFGANPRASLVQATDGNFYGTTQEGGSDDSCKPRFSGCGTVFKITPEGALTTLLSFDETDGADPYAGLVQATNGNFYGTTRNDGANDYGTVFEITTSGVLTTLHNFDSQPGASDGTYPEATLVQATNGNFYGTTLEGGAGCAPIGCGTVFKITPSGTLTTLHKFDGTNGVAPQAGLIQATDGNFYGTTEGGGANKSGTVFKITTSGTLTTLYSFCSQTGCSDGSEPFAALIQATDGNLYGTTLGGANNGGTIFQITLSGTLTTLYTFCSQPNCMDGSGPMAGLVQATNGIFYGTTAGGGADGEGTVFSLSVGLGPFVETQTTAGKVGAAINILGSDLTGATSVTFNGTAATFTVVSPSLITTTVPAGATSGTVQVATPGGTLSSNVPFLVLP